MKTPEDQAAEILVYYMQRVWESAGLGWTGDNEVEIRQIVESIIEAARPAAPAKRGPVDPELFERTAPSWNCVDFPGEGMHYTPTLGDCLWCGTTREQISAEHEAAFQSVGDDQARARQ